MPFYLQLASVDASSAVEIYARNGEWEKCLKVCLEIRDLKLLAKYLYEYGVILLKKGEESKAVELFTNYGTPVTADTLDVFRHIFFAFLAKRYKDVNEGFRQWCSLRDLIHTAVSTGNWVRVFWGEFRIFAVAKIRKPTLLQHNLWVFWNYENCERWKLC